MTEQYVAVTGGTGLLAKEIVQRLIARGYKIIFFGRGKNDQTLEARVRAHFSDFSGTLLSGCIYEELSLTDIDKDALAQKLSQYKPSCFLHAAANLSFKDEDREQTFQENFYASTQLFEACETALVPFAYVSTAFVHGTRTGILKEGELIRPWKFNNYYEESKFEAETFFHQRFTKKLPLIILRPGILISHEKSHTYNFGFYVLAKSLIRFRKGILSFMHAKPRLAHFLGIALDSEQVLHLPLPFFYAKKCAMDLVSIEWVAEGITRILVKDVLATGALAELKTYQLSNPRPIPFSDVLSHTCRGSRISFIPIGSPELVAKMYLGLIIGLGHVLPFLSDFGRKLKYYKYYVTTDFTHDITNTRTVIDDDAHTMTPEILFDHADHFFNRPPHHV